VIDERPILPRQDSTLILIRAFNQKEKTMKNIIILLVLLIAAFQSETIMAAENIAGTWQGKLITGPGSEIRIEFIIKQEVNGSYSAILNSLDSNALKNIKADSVLYASGVLKLNAADVNGYYEGVLKNGKIDGKWKQEGASFPLTLNPYEKPSLSKKDIGNLLGTWQGKLSVTGITVTHVFRFEMSEKGEFVGYLDLPDYGTSGTPLTDVGMSDGSFVFKVPTDKLDYKGKLNDGEITGVLSSYGTPYPLILKKGEYKSLVYKLILSKEDTKLLLGKWSGKLGPSNLIIRFERTKDGDFVGFMDDPDQGTKGMPITEANWKDGKVTLKIAGVNAEFKGQLSADKFAGDWTQGGKATPLSMIKEKP